jgi:hypothetical protein
LLHFLIVFLLLQAQVLFFFFRSCSCCSKFAFKCCSS